MLERNRLDKAASSPLAIQSIIAWSLLYSTNN
jgi:hypothetical protein